MNIEQFTFLKFHAQEELNTYLASWHHLTYQRKLKTEHRLDQEITDKEMDAEIAKLDEIIKKYKSAIIALTLIYQNHGEHNQHIPIQTGPESKADEKDGELPED